MAAGAADGESDADPDGEVGVGGEAERLVQRGADAVEEVGGVLGGVDVGGDDELVAAEAGDGVVGAEGGLQAADDGGEDLVAAFVAEGVVDRLEVVEVAEQDRDPPAVPFGGSQREGDPVGQQQPVRGAGERVVQR